MFSVISTSKYRNTESFRQIGLQILKFSTSFSTICGRFLSFHCLLYFFFFVAFNVPATEFTTRERQQQLIYKEATKFEGLPALPVLILFCFFFFFFATNKKGEKRSGSNDSAPSASCCRVRARALFFFSFLFLLYERFQ